MRFRASKDQTGAEGVFSEPQAGTLQGTPPEGPWGEGLARGGPGGRRVGRRELLFFPLGVIPQGLAWRTPSPPARHSEKLGPEGKPVSNFRRKVDTGVCEDGRGEGAICFPPCD